MTINWHVHTTFEARIGPKSMDALRAGDTVKAIPALDKLDRGHKTQGEVFSKKTDQRFQAM